MIDEQTMVSGLVRAADKHRYKYDNSVNEAVVVDTYELILAAITEADDDLTPSELAMSIYDAIQAPTIDESDLLPSIPPEGSNMTELNNGFNPTIVSGQTSQYTKVSPEVQILAADKLNRLLEEQS
ncbi:MAG: hypothetical protein U9Q66_01440 [Patescibacteria group bacterium]|nr:hypothetical protein [Patescibacteria group bacterium]